MVNNPLALGPDRHDLQARGVRATTSGRSATTASNAVAGRTGALPHTVARAGDRPRPGHQRDARGRTPPRPTRPRWTCPAAARGRRSSRPLAVVAGGGEPCSAARPARLTGEMCARIALAEIKQADALLQPLRLDRRGAGRRRQHRATRCSAAPRTTSRARSATIDAYTGKPPHVTGVNVLLKVRRGADQAFMRRISLPARRPAGPAGPRPRLAAARPRRHAHAHLHAPHPRRRRARQPAAAASSASDADAGDERPDDDHPRRGRRARRGRRPRPGDAAASSPPRSSATGRYDGVSSASAAPARGRSATTTSASPATPKRRPG